MTNEHLSREAMPRAVEGPSVLSSKVRGRGSAPHLAVWLPLAIKVAAAGLAAVVLAAIGARAGAHVPPTDDVPAAASNTPPATHSDGDFFAPDAAAAPIAAGSDGGAEPGSAVLADGRIVLNLASEDELTKLPGVGPSRARAILALRQRLTKFRAVEDLLRVKGIGRKTLRRLRPSLVLDRPPAEHHQEPASAPRPEERAAPS